MSSWHGTSLSTGTTLTLPLTPCVASHRVFIIIVYFLYNSVRQLLDTPS